MSVLTRRLIVLVFCCWLPIPAAAAMAFECHLITAAVVAQHGSSAEASEALTEHSGCGGAVVPATQVVELSANAVPCDHCQIACHAQQLVLLSADIHVVPIAPQSFAAYFLPLSKTVFLDGPQRPPQAV